MDHLEDLYEESDGSWSSAECEGPQIPHHHFEEGVLFVGVLLDVVLDELHQTLGGEVGDVLGVGEELEEEGDDHEDIGGVWLLGVGEEPDEVDGEGLHELVRGVLDVAAHFEDEGEHLLIDLPCYLLERVDLGLLEGTVLVRVGGTLPYQVDDDGVHEL